MNPLQSNPRRGRVAPEDMETAKRIRHFRTRIGMSQQDLGKAIGVSFQQVQKYESGSNRVSVATLKNLARALNVTPAMLIDDDPPETYIEAGRTDLVLYARLARLSLEQKHALSRLLEAFDTNQSLPHTAVRGE